MPPGTPIVAFVPGDRTALKPGETMFTARVDEGGKLSTQRIPVSKDGVRPRALRLAAMRGGPGGHNFGAELPPRSQRDAARPPMVVEFTDAVTAAAVYINPAFVISVRPDPADADRVSIVKLSDGESVRVRGDHRQVADKLRRV